MLEQLLPLLKEGQTIEIRPQGTSMFPLLTEGRDSVIIQALGNDVPKRGDLLLYQRRKGRLFSVKHPVYLLFSRAWLFLRPIRPYISRPLGTLWRAIHHNVF